MNLSSGSWISSGWQLCQAIIYRKCWRSAVYIDVRLNAMLQLQALNYFPISDYLACRYCNCADRIKYCEWFNGIKSTKHLYCCSKPEAMFGMSCHLQLIELNIFLFGFSSWGIKVRATTSIGSVNFRQGIWLRASIPHSHCALSLSKPPILSVSPGLKAWSKLGIKSIRDCGIRNGDWRNTRRGRSGRRWDGNWRRDVILTKVLEA